MLYLVTHHTAPLLLSAMSTYAHDILDLRLLCEVERHESSSMAAITDHKTEIYSKG